MSATPDPFDSRPPELDSLLPGLLSARNLSVVALVLFVLFGTVVAGVVFPLQPLDSAWQLRWAGALINASPFPLLGLALLHLASELDPDDPILWRRWRRCSQLSVLVAVGFLLLLPLQSVAGLKESRSFHVTQSTRIVGAERKLSALRQAVSSAASNAGLNEQLQRLQGPVPGPADLAQPLPLLKAQVNAVLDQAQNQIAKERQAVPPANPWTLLPDLLRNAVACLALAIGFAALAVRPGAEVSLLQEWQARWQRSTSRRASRGEYPSEEDYFQQLSDEQENPQDRGR